MHRITEIRFLTESTFVLRMEREDLQFRPGQHLIVGLEKELNQREYSIYSGEADDYLEILVKTVPDGSVSLQLKDCKPGDLLQVNGPFGSFGLEKFDMYTRKFVFIATGTGISPFHSFVRSYPGMDYTLLHGVRFEHEAYDRNHYDPNRYIICTSGERTSGKQGRVTLLLKNYPLTTSMLFYLCGNNLMIHDVTKILTDRGIPQTNIFSEIYF